MTALLNILEDYLTWRKWRYCRIDGSTKIDDRQRQMDVFNVEKTTREHRMWNMSDDRYFVFMLSTRAGGLGKDDFRLRTFSIYPSDFIGSLSSIRSVVTSCSVPLTHRKFSRYCNDAETNI